MLDWNTSRVARTIDAAHTRVVTALCINEGSSYVAQLPGLA